MSKETTQVDRIIAYEQGELDTEATVSLFQELINSGLAWQLQGHYGRTAKELIDNGYCTPPKDRLYPGIKAPALGKEFK